MKARNAHQAFVENLALGHILLPSDVPRRGVQTAAEEIFPSITSLTVLPNGSKISTLSSIENKIIINHHNNANGDCVDGIVAKQISEDSEETEQDTDIHIKKPLGISANDNRAILCSILGMVDTKVRVSNQLAQIEDTVRVKSALENRRIHHFNDAGDVLSQLMTYLQTQHTSAELVRGEVHMETLAHIGTLEVEEKDLAERLKRIREEISQAKRSFVEEQECCKLGRLSEKARISFATKESKKCSEMLTVAERNKELLKKFKSYVKSVTTSRISSLTNIELNQKKKFAKLSENGGMDKTLAFASGKGDVIVLLIV